jgi:hypothetical protein
MSKFTPVLKGFFTTTALTVMLEAFGSQVKKEENCSKVYIVYFYQSLVRFFNVPK